MDEKFKEIGLKYGLTQSQTKQLFNHQFKVVVNCIRESRLDLLEAKNVRIPLLGTFFRSLHSIKKMYKYDKRESTPAEAT